MRVAILNRPREFYPGGDMIVVDAHVKALAELGVEAVYMDYYPGGPPKWGPAELRAFDLIHIHHCQFDFSLNNFRETWESGTPYVVTPIWYPHYWYSSMTKELTLKALAEARRILPFSQAEWLEIITELPDLAGRRMDTVPNGTDVSFHAPDGGDAREGVVAVSARGESDKNVGLIQRACEQVALPFTIVSWKPHEEMPALYRAHKLFVTASNTERMSLTVGEALCSGCRVVSTVHNRGNSWYPGIVAHDLTAMTPEAVGELLLRYYNDPDWGWTPNRVARRMTWRSVAEKLKAVYEEALA